jgi:predicted outer membrane repeat protein
MMSGNNTFHNNSALFSSHYFAPSHGGTLLVDHGMLTISGNACISHSKASLGGAIYMLDSQAIFKGDSLVFHGNVATSDGGGMWIQSTTIITLTRSLRFTNNVAEGTGGALSIDNSHDSDKKGEQVILSGEFINNTGYYGGAVYATSAQLTFTDTTMISNSGDALTISNSNITFTGTTCIFNHTGGAVIAEESSIVFENDTIFDSNNGRDGGALNSLQGTVLFLGHTRFQRNQADGNGGALYAVGTSIHFQNHVSFISNTARVNGGAIYLDTGATLTLKTFITSWNNPSIARSQLSTSHNFAHQYGGGIYHVDSPTTHQCSVIHSFEVFKKMPYCFLRAVPFEYDDLPSIKITSVTQ